MASNKDHQHVYSISSIEYTPDGVKYYYVCSGCNHKKENKAPHGKKKEKNETPKTE